MSSEFKIASFYRFTELTDLADLRLSLISCMESHGVFGTIIIAGEGFNATVATQPEKIEQFLSAVFGIFGVEAEVKFSSHKEAVFQRRKVKIKREIVTLRKDVRIGLGEGTHVGALEWNKIISNSDTVVIDARNDYEFRAGTFKGAINPETESFSELPSFVESKLKPAKETTIAMFCTGGIRCEKFAPYLIEQGFLNIVQLDGGILKYLEEIKGDESLWEGECFVFDERITVDQQLEKGSKVDYSSEKTTSQKKT